jgi:hypothetical protein
MIKIGLQPDKRGTDGLKPREIGDNHPSAKADGNIYKELLFLPFRQLKLPTLLSKADGNAKKGGASRIRARRAVPLHFTSRLPVSDGSPSRPYPCGK